MGLSKIIKKVNKAKSAVKSVKGIGAKLKSLQYDSVTDQLGQEAHQAKNYLQNSRKGNFGAKQTHMTKSLATSKSPPYEISEDLIYPLSDALPNYLVFTIKPRRNNSKRRTTTKKKEGDASNKGLATKGLDNVFSEKDVERDILLYVPEGTSSEASASYGTADMSLASRAMDAVAEGYKNNGFTGALDAGGMGFDQLLKTQMTAFLNTMTGGVQNVKEGRGKNPMTEALFEGLTFRQHKFDYEFWPKNQDEADMVQRIIYTFRTAMLPDTYGERIFNNDDESNAGGFGQENENEHENYFNFPNVFNIAYEGPLAQTLDGFLPCVLTDCSIDNFNGNKVAMIGEGYPVSTSMSLTFQEIRMLTQETYQQISPLGNSTITPMKSLNPDAN